MGVGWLFMMHYVGVVAVDNVIRWIYFTSLFLVAWSSGLRFCWFGCHK